MNARTTGVLPCASALLISVGAGVFLAQSLSATGSAQNATAEVRTRRIIVVDAANRQRAVIGEDTDGLFGIRLYDRKHKERAGLTLMREGEPVLALLSHDKKVRAGLSLLPDGSPNFSFQDAGTETQAELAILPNGKVSFYMRNRNGKEVTLTP